MLTVCTTRNVATNFKTEKKKPQWYDRNKKGICNAITEVMLSVAQRRMERKKSKEEGGKHTFHLIFTIIRTK